MVCRLIKKEGIRLLQKEFSHCDAHLPATGKFPAVTFEVIPSKTKATKDRLDSRFDSAWVKVLQSELKLPYFLQDIRVGRINWIKAIQLRRVLFNFELELASLLEC